MITINYALLNIFIVFSISHSQKCQTTRTIIMTTKIFYCALSFVFLTISTVSPLEGNLQLYKYLLSMTYLDLINDLFSMHTYMLYLQFWRFGVVLFEFFILLPYWYFMLKQYFCVQFYLLDII